jgi:predicted aminopeptidase
MRWLLGLGLSGLLAAATLCLTSGCADVGYMARSVSGHLQLMNAAKPVQQWLDDTSQPEALRERLLLSQRMRDFAVRKLQLPDNRSYRAYADLQRPYAVWNVAAAPELSLTLKTWCFPLMGCVAYRGYFDQQQAEAFAQSLRGPGLEVTVYGVPAYSTLGWSEWLGGDPLLNGFIRYPEGELARLVFHELAHQVAYASDDTTFNESFASCVERLGVKAWLDAEASVAARQEYAVLEQRRVALRKLTGRYREQLDALYRSQAGDEAKRSAKASLMAGLQSDYLELKTHAWAGFGGYDGWMARVNNASLGMLAAYDELTPQFDALFEREGRDFERFYAAVLALSRLPKDERRARLSEHYALRAP